MSMVGYAAGARIAREEEREGAHQVARITKSITCVRMPSIREQSNTRLSVPSLAPRRHRNTSAEQHQNGKQESARHLQILQSGTSLTQRDLGLCHRHCSHHRNMAAAASWLLRWRCCGAPSSGSTMGRAGCQQRRSPAHLKFKHHDTHAAPFTKRNNTPCNGTK